MIKLKKIIAQVKFHFLIFPQNEHSCIEVGFMNDTEIEYENSKRLRLYFSFLTTETRAGTADVA